MEIKTRFLDHETLEVTGAVNGSEARGVAQKVTERRTGLVSHFIGLTYKVTLLDPRPSPEPIFTEAMARGVQLSDGEVQWNNEAQAWMIHGVDIPSHWLNENAPVANKTMFMVAARTMDMSTGIQRVQIDAARYVVADNVVDAIEAMAMFLDRGEHGTPVVEREGALTFAGYPGTTVPRFVACTSHANDRLRIADPSGAVITA